MPPDRPFRATLATGDLVVWCACGLSQRQPYCDGSHRGTAHRPVRYTVPQNLTVALCGCKETKQPPFCDGSHIAYRTRLAARASGPAQSDSDPEQKG